MAHYRAGQDLLPILTIQVHPAGQQQPAFAFHESAHASSLPEKFHSAHFINGLVGQGRAQEGPSA